MGSSTTTVDDRLRLRLLHLGGTSIDRQWGGHDYVSAQWRVYLNLDDGAWGEVRGRRTMFAAGRLYVVPAWLHWISGCRGHVRHLNAFFDLPVVGRETIVATADAIYDLGGPGAALPAAWLALGIALAEVPLVTPALTARGYHLTYAAVEALFTQLGVKAERLLAPRASSGLGSLLALIEQRLSGALPVAALAALAGCSAAELHRRFQVGVGTSPATWVRTRRVLAATEWLRTSDLDIAAIATRVGFADRVRFSKVFAQHMGLGPAAWRRRERTA